ncbi:MAG: hypothetical protein ACWGOY_05595 [Anaerolineales bacterium]
MVDVMGGTMQSSEYFVWKRPVIDESFRVVRREVHSRTHKGYPISYVLKSIPVAFETWDKAQFVANKLNLELLQGKLQDWPEEDIQDID